MSTIVTRAGKGTPLTHNEVDANFTNLNTDKLEKAGGAVTGALSVAGIFTVGTSTPFAATPTSPCFYAPGGITAASPSGIVSFIALGGTDTTNGPYIRLRQDATSSRLEAGIAGTGAYTPLSIYTSAAERLRVDTSGRVAINRNSASFSTGTARTAIAYPGNTDWALGLRDTSAQSTVYPIVFLNSSEGIAGSVAMTATSTSYNTSSDERLKENIEDAADPGAVIDAIQIRQFDWIATGEHQDYGVVAQELEQVYPPAVPEATLGPDGVEMYRGVDYSKLVPLLVKEVQLLRARVAQLEGGSQ